MNTVKRTARLLAICCVCTVLSPADEAEEPDMSEPARVILKITDLDINESTLTLSYTIINETDRDAWICSSIAASPKPFEVFLTSDKRTLLIRKRLDVPTTAIWRPPGPVGTYVHIAPGASLADCVQIGVPVSPRFLYATLDRTELAQTVTTDLALEIGYYDADLPGIIREIIAVAEKSGLTIGDVPGSILDTYFRGLRVRGVFADFDLVNKDPYGQGWVSIPYSRQALTDEKVLRVDVNNVSIAYEGYCAISGTP